MPTPTPSPLRLLPGTSRVWLHDSAASRQVEAAASAARAPHALIEAAGLAVARWAVALAPHARRVWVAAGPGNNGGDGLVAARWLRQLGRQVHVCWLGDPARLPADAAHARDAALAAGLTLHPPGVLPAGAEPPELVLDALLGLGQARPPEGALAAEVQRIRQWHAAGRTVLAVDLPTGLCADTGRRLGAECVRAHATLALLTAKPGLFTADGRDAAGDVWLDTLGVPVDTAAAGARLLDADDARDALAARAGAGHGGHKGSFGDVLVVGGAPGMTGAALLAGRAALRAGGGRVYVCLLGGDGAGVAASAPELMARGWAEVAGSRLADEATVVCGCGGGEAVRMALPHLLSRAARLVLDADALNALATDAALQRLLRARAGRRWPTVLTPHPLEAARLLGVPASQVQADRLNAARGLADAHQAVVVLKGSGTVVAAPGGRLMINPTGNARLATAGTGDVLAGWTGGCWSALAAVVRDAADGGSTAATAAAGSVWLHGRAAQRCDGRAGTDAEADAGRWLPLTAARLVDAMAAAADALLRAGPAR